MMLKNLELEQRFTFVNDEDLKRMGLSREDEPFCMIDFGEYPARTYTACTRTWAEVTLWPDTALVELAP